ncbi:hypothetical protein [Amphritea balenae]|uniref:PqqD family protein n=1 Tax=Amphritea balenae TaxID=452629 RepID=A0A3P1SNB6_9GAMM|nr:hypothetical protein [Amphritea balenae]RRC97732.1 hypothetical protein EHS89_16250 [Amphritea balenae]GGK82570.1 hypothetical protein GCM10007941_36260 [Amphritea balenae]
MDTSQYFYRNVVFTRKGGKVALVDIHNPEHTTDMEDWLGIVISLADGKHTLQQLIDYMAAQYPASAPTELNKTIESVVERLTEGNMLKLTDKEIELPYYLSEPVERLSLDVARQKMHDDGYTQH